MRCIVIFYKYFIFFYNSCFVSRLGMCRMCSPLQLPRAQNVTVTRGSKREDTDHTPVGTKKIRQTCCLRYNKQKKRATRLSSASFSLLCVLHTRHACTTQESGEPQCPSLSLCSPQAALNAVSATLSDEAGKILFFASGDRSALEEWRGLRSMKHGGGILFWDG